MGRQNTAAPRKHDETGTWWFVVDLPPGSNGGRRQARRRGFATKKAAQEALDELRNSSRQGTFVAPAKTTLSEYLTAEWLPAVRRELADSTYESYARNIRVHIVPALGGIKLQQLDGLMISRFYGQLLASGRKIGKQSAGLKPRTVRYIATILHAALDDAVKSRRIPHNPAAQAKPPSASAAKAPEMRAWTGPQLRRFLQLVEENGDRYYYPWLVLATTGARRGEILGLRWSDVDLDAGQASIRQTVISLPKTSGKGREGRIVPRTKTDRARVIELDATTVAALRAWKAQHARDRLLLGSGYQNNDLIFCQPDGRPLQPEAFSTAFDRRLAQEKFSELPRIRLHDLRHTWATLALVAGIDVSIVSKRLGHSSPIVTWQTYQHVVKGMQTDAAEKVAALIFGA